MRTERQASIGHSEAQGSTTATTSETTSRARARAPQVATAVGQALLPVSRRSSRQQSRKLAQVAATCIAMFCMVEIAYTSTLLRSIDTHGSSRVLWSPQVDQQLFARIRGPNDTPEPGYAQGRSKTEGSSLMMQMAVNKATDTKAEPKSAADEYLAPGLPTEAAAPSPSESTPPTEVPNSTPLASALQIDTANSPRKDPPKNNTSSTLHDKLRDRSDDFDTSVSCSKGVVICLHGGILSMGLSLIRDLRCLGNTELVQIYYCFPDELSLKSRDALMVNDPRVEIIDVCLHYMGRGALTKEVATKFRNWWVNPLALVHTNLQDVVLLDADVIPMQNPANLRKLPGYVRTGTTFFYGRVINSKVYFNTLVRGKHYLHDWLETFDYATFNLSDGVEPTVHMITSFAFAGKTCHEQDSSMKRFEFEFSFGDKESFWLAFEFARYEYFFSPWGTSVVSSTPNKDMQNRPDTLCGSIAHFVPVEDDSNYTPELLYVNGKALLTSLPLSAMELKRSTFNNWYNPNPTHVTPRQRRRESGVSSEKKYRRFPQECLVGLGSTPLSEHFQKRLLQRRLVLMAVEAKLPVAAIECSRF